MVRSIDPFYMYFPLYSNTIILNSYANAVAFRRKEKNLHFCKVSVSFKAAKSPLLSERAFRYLNAETFLIGFLI